MMIVMVVCEMNPNSLAVQVWMGWIIAAEGTVYKFNTQLLSQQEPLAL
jgi:hypothetical protein